MAKSHHTSAAHSPVRIPTNPLSRPCGPFADIPHNPQEQDAVTLAGITTAIHALARVLANSEAFRELHANCESDTLDPGHCPLDAITTEGLFAALCYLSQQAEAFGQLPELGPTDPSGITY